MPKPENLLELDQTATGLCSDPWNEDVLAALQGERDWAEPYAQAGHGEYIANTEAMAEWCRRYHLTPDQARQDVVWVFR